VRWTAGTLVGREPREPGIRLMEIDMLHETPETVAAPGEVERSLEAILMIADEPQTRVARHGTRRGRPGWVRQSIDDSSPITTAKEVALEHPPRLRTREVGADGASTCAASMTTSCATSCSRRTPIAALPGRARDARRDRLQAADQPGRRRVDPSRECGFCRAHASSVADSSPRHSPIRRPAPSTTQTTDLTLIQLGINSSIDELLATLFSDGSDGFADVI
jgi:hypothetical protein